MKTIEEFKALSLAQIEELGYDKIIECETRLRDILSAKAQEINERAKAMFSEIIGDVCPDFEISTTVSAYRMFVIRIPKTRCEINIDVDMDGYGEDPFPEITVSTFPNIGSYSFTRPDKNTEKLIKMYYAVLFKENTHSTIFSFVMSAQEELDKIKDVFRRYKKISNSIKSKEDMERKTMEIKQLQKDCLRVIRREKPQYVRVVIKDNPVDKDMYFIYRGDLCNIYPDKNGVFTSDYKRKKDEYDVYDSRVRWIPADRLRDRNEKYILNDPLLYR